MNYGVIGSGNLASQLVKALIRAGYPPMFIISRNKVTGKRLSRISGSPLLEEPPRPGRSKPLLLVCTNDDAIPDLFRQHAKAGYILVHFSGGLPLIAPKADCPGSGVIWPVQSISKKSRLNWLNIPLCIEACNETSRRKLLALARVLGGPVYELTGRQRARVHLAAVFANNFANAQFTMAKQLLEEVGLDFELLTPLITQTAQGILQSAPESLQTGPARRGDKDVIRKHLMMLKDEQEIQAVYAAITSFLLKKYNH